MMKCPLHIRNLSVGTLFTMVLSQLPSATPRKPQRLAPQAAAVDITRSLTLLFRQPQQRPHHAAPRFATGTISSSPALPCSTCSLRLLPLLRVCFGCWTECLLLPSAAWAGDKQGLVILHQPQPCLSFAPESSLCRCTCCIGLEWCRSPSYFPPSCISPCLNPHSSLLFLLPTPHSSPLARSQSTPRGQPPTAT